MGISQSKGIEFEKTIEHLLILMGYRVSRNNLINGTQIDLLAERQDVINNIRIIVECADREEPIGIDLLKQKASTLLTLNDPMWPYRLLFVSRTGFTAEAKAFANSYSNITILRHAELESQLIDFRPYAHWYTENYRRSEGMFHDARLYENYVELAARDEKDILSPSLTQEVTQWLQDKDNNLLFLLGEFGSGKTSFCRQFIYSILTRKYLHDKPATHTPILINLRNYRRSLNIQQVVTDTLVNQYGISLPSFMAFERLCGGGLILLVLDGFDEMADRCDTQTLIDSFSQIFLLATVNTKVLVTCRSNVFKSHADIIALLKKFSIAVPGDENEPEVATFDFDRHGRIVYVEKLDEARVREFISKRFDTEADSVFQTIRSVHDLSDLATRPVLLDMILSTLPALRAKDRHINSAALYDEYIDRWSARDAWRVNTAPEIREQFCETLSWLMHSHGLTELNSGVLERLMLDTIANVARDENELEKFRHDVQICSFLVGPDSKDAFRFAHKSFLEFLVARKVVKDIIQGIASKKVEGPPAEDKQLFTVPLGEFVDAGRRMVYIPSFISIAETITDRLRDLRSSRAYGLSWALQSKVPPARVKSGQESLASVVESQLQAVFGQHIKGATELGLSEEIATFGMELLENRQIPLDKLLSTLIDKTAITIFAELIRLSKSAEFVRRNAATAQTYIKTGSSELLKVALCSGFARAPELVNMEFIREARARLKEADWSYLLFEIARERHSAELLAAVSKWGDIRAIDRLICAFAQSVTVPSNYSPTDPFEVTRLAVTELIQSQDEKDVAFAISLSPFLNLSEPELVQMLVGVVIRFRKSSLMQDAVSILQTLNGEEVWRGVRQAAFRAGESDPETRRLLRDMEQRLRDRGSRAKARAGWEANRSSQELRDRVWNLLRR